MKVFVRDYNSEVINELNDLYHNPPEKPWEFEADFATNDIFSVKADVFVSPANSFGYMDGGIDLYFVTQLGWSLEDKAKIAAIEQPFGEMLIGSAVHIMTGDVNRPHMIMAPTMRTPRQIPAENAFLATRAAMQVALEIGYDSILFPGMGTGTGNVQPGDAARAMLTGIQAATLNFNKRK